MLDLTSLPLGTKLVTRDGRLARLIATDLKSHDGECVAVVDCGDYGEHAVQFHWNGLISGSHGPGGNVPVDIVFVMTPPASGKGRDGEGL